MPTETYGKDYIRYGKDNLFPETLFDFYNKCGLLRSILNTMLDYTAGSGFESTPDQPINKRGMLLSSLVKKCTLDYLIFGSFSIQVLRNQFGDVSELYWIDQRQVRLNQEETQVYWRKDWTGKTPNTNKKPFVYEANDNNAKNSIFVFKTPVSRNTYGSPVWEALYQEVQTLISIDNYNANSVLNGFIPSALINVVADEPDEDAKRRIKSQFEDAFMGTENAAGIVMVYSPDKEHFAEITPYAADQNSERYLNVLNTTQTSLYSGLRVPPIIVGTLAERTNFSAQEFKDAFALTNATVISPMQREIETAFASIKNIDGNSPFSFKLKSFEIDFGDTDGIPANNNQTNESIIDNA